MSNRFLKFAPNDGTGPDAQLPHYPEVPVARITEMKNCRIEADGRIVGEPGWELTGSAIGVTSHLCGCDGITVTDDEWTNPSSMLRIHRSRSGVQLDDATTSLEHGPLTPLFSRTLAEADDTILGTYTNISASLTSVSALSGISGIVVTANRSGVTGGAVWFLFDAATIGEISRGEFPRDTATYNSCRVYLCGPGVLYIEAASAGDALYRLYTASTSTGTLTLVATWTNTVAGEVADRIGVDSDASMLFEGIGYNKYLIAGDLGHYYTTDGATVTEVDYDSGNYAGTQLTYGCHSSSRYNYGSDCAKTDSDSVIFLRKDVSTSDYYITYQDGIGGEKTAAIVYAALDSDWRKWTGVWPGKADATSPYMKSAWVTGLKFYTYWGVADIWVLFAQDPTWSRTPSGAYAAPLDTAVREFPGPYLDMGIEGCIVFGGPSRRAIYLVDPNNDTGIYSSDTTLTQIGVHGFNGMASGVRGDWIGAVLTPNNTLVAMGRDYLNGYKVTIQAWKVIRGVSTVTSDHTSKFIEAQNTPSGALLTGALPAWMTIGNRNTSPDVAVLPNLLVAPKAPTQSGASGAGTHQYCCHWCAYAPDGTVVNGPVSAISTRTLTDSVVYHPGECGITESNAKLKIFRTADADITFHLVATLTISAFGGLESVVVDTNAADSAIIDREILYTQGATGSLSGRTETTSTPPCRYYYATPTRHIIGGIEDPNSVRLSDSLVTGELPHWPIGGPWYVSVGSTVMGVGEQDGEFLVFTSSGVFSFGGEGPDAVGQGFWGVPQKVCPVGVRSERSIVETDIGWIYQGIDFQFWLYRRGSGAAECISLNQRNRLRGTTDTNTFEPNSSVLSSTYDPENGLAYFRMTWMESDSLVTTAAKLMVFDTRNGMWFENEIGSGATIGNVFAYSSPDRLLWGDCVRSAVSYRIQQRRRPAQGTDPPYIWWLGPFDAYSGVEPNRAPSFTTANLTEWGKGGWGRVRCIGLVCTQDDGSVHIGASYSVQITAMNDADTQESLSCDGSPQDGVIEFHPAEQKCSCFRVTVADYSSAPLIFHGIQIEQSDYQRGRVR